MSFKIKKTKYKDRKIINEKVIDNIYMDVAKDIVMNENMNKMKECIQHGDTTCYMHSLMVAYLSLVIAVKFNIICDERSLVRGALLHDYFLYDWHKREESLRFHGFVHPKKALENAMKEYELNDIEKNIIKTHMFPLTIVPPKYIEGMIVSTADKICSIFETLKFRRKQKYKMLIMLRRIREI